MLKMANGDMDKVTLSVICIAYNQVGFIRDCLNGFITQQTHFKFEVLIHDDASTDGTAEVIREYAEQYPDIFVAYYQSENQFSQGIDIEKQFLFPKIKGRYVAFCEGDDYWTDPLKLQKQVDFLEKNKDYSVCFHPVIVHWDDRRLADYIFPSQADHFYKETLCITDLCIHNFIQTNSVVYRWRFRDESLDTIPDGILPSDWFLHLLHAQKGKIKYLDDVMGVYRRNSSGIWTNAGVSSLWFQRYGNAYLAFLKQKERMFHTNEKDEFLLNLSKILCLHGDAMQKNYLKSLYADDVKMLIQRQRFSRWLLLFNRLKKIGVSKSKKHAAKVRIHLYKLLLTSKEHLL